MAPRRTSGSGSGFDLGLASTASASASTLPPSAQPPIAQTQTRTRTHTPASISASASASASASSPFHRSSRPPALSAASLFSASASAASPAASGPATATVTATASPSTAPPQRLSFPFSPIPSSSSAAASPSASAFASSASSTAAASAAASATASASASASTTAAAAAAAAASPFSSASTARPILPPLPPLPQVSPLGRFLSERPLSHSHSHSHSHSFSHSHSHSHLSEFASPRPFPVSPDSLTTLQPDPYSPLNSPFGRRPLLLGPQSTSFWSTYRTQLDQPTDWLQDDSAAPNIGVLAARAFGFNLSDFASSFTPFTSQPPLVQSPSQPPRRSPDLRFPFDSGSSPAPPPASIATSASALQAASASTSASAAPSSRHLHHARAPRATSTSRISATAENPASPPASGQGFAHPSNSAEAAFDSDNSALDDLFYELDGFPGFPLPVADTANPSSLSTFATMPPASRRSLRSRVQPPEDHDSSASTPNASKRRRVSASVAQPTSLETVIDDDDGENWPLFGSTPPRPGSSSDLKNEDFTTIDLTEVNDVPEELKKPEVDNRVKLSAFQCVICMDDVTGLTLTHCGHLFCAQCLYSSLSIESTRGKCPMCRAKIDMKPRENYSTKTKGYWPLELKLMTRTRQGKRKAQDME